MGRDTDSSITVGYVIDVDDFFKPFLKKRKEKSHMEPRFDPKTGKPAGEEKVVDQEAGWDIIFGDVTAEGPEDPKSKYGWSWYPEDDLMDEVRHALKCSVTLEGNFYDGGPYFLCIEPDSIEYKDGVVQISSICKAEKEIERIGKKIREFDVDPGTAGVHTVVTST